MTTVLDLQRALVARGFNVDVDGYIGPQTLGAAVDAVLKFPASFVHPALTPATSVPRLSVPADWMPWAKMQRIIVHWTAGQNTASDLDREHYHILIEGSGKAVRGKPSIMLNEAPVKPGYAAHTLNCNSGSIGVSLCGMVGAQQSPFKAGKAPLTREQWDVLPSVLADLCRRYSIPVGPDTVLSHAEVQATLGIAQRGKWDIAILPFDTSLNTAKKVGDSFRAATKVLL